MKSIGTNTPGMLLYNDYFTSEDIKTGNVVVEIKFIVQAIEYLKKRKVIITATRPTWLNDNAIIIEYRRK